MERMLRHLIEQNELDIRRLGEALADGAAKDFSAYCTVTGKVHGLRTANTRMIDMLQKILNGEDE